MAKFCVNLKLWCFSSGCRLTANHERYLKSATAAPIQYLERPSLHLSSALLSLSGLVGSSYQHDLASATVPLSSNSLIMSSHPTSQSNCRPTMVNESPCSPSKLSILDIGIDLRYHSRPSDCPRESRLYPCSNPPCLSVLLFRKPAVHRPLPHPPTATAQIRYTPYSTVQPSSSNCLAEAGSIPGQCWGACRSCQVHKTPSSVAKTQSNTSSSHAR